MSNALDSLAELIVESARDDIESFETLKTDVTRWASDDGIPYSDEAFVNAIHELVRTGVLIAFLFDRTKQHYEEIGPSQLSQQLDDIWFRAKRDA